MCHHNQRKKRHWKYMELTKKSVSGIFLHIIAWFEIIYNGFVILGILGLKIYTAPLVQKEILKLKSKLKELLFHLKGLGVAAVEIDVETLEKLMHALVWFIFVLGMIWLVINFGMAIYLVRGLRQERPRNLKVWIIFGVISLILNILIYPIEVVVCGHAKNVLGPVCEPSGTNAWLKIILKIIYYSSMWVAWVHRKELLDPKKKVPFSKVTLSFSEHGDKFMDSINKDEDKENGNETQLTQVSQITIQNDLIQT